MLWSTFLLRFRLNVGSGGYFKGGRGEGISHFTLCYGGEVLTEAELSEKTAQTRQEIVHIYGFLQVIRRPQVKNFASDL